MSSVLFSLLFTISQAQTVRPALSASTLFPGAYSLKEADAFSFLSNQAALANVTTLSGGLYGERKFLLPELSFYQATLCLPTTSGQFGFAGRYSGYSGHYEAAAGLAYGRKLGGRLDIGVQFNYQMMQVAGYGAASALYAEAGVLLHLHKQVHLGLHASNPTAAGMGKENKDLLPSVYTAAVGYEVSPLFFVATEVQKVLHRSVLVNAGMQYRFDERLWARVGFRSEVSAYYLGLGYRLKTLRLEATAHVHPHLGVTPGLQIIFQKEKSS